MKARENNQGGLEMERETMRAYISRFNRIKRDRDEVWQKIVAMNPLLSRYPHFKTEYAETLYQRYCEAYDYLQKKMDAIADLPVTIHTEDTAGM